MKQKLLFLSILILLFGSGLRSWGQAVFTDDFSTNTSATYTTSGAIGASAWSITRSGADWGGRRNTSPAQLELTNDASGTGNVNGWVLGSTSTSSFSSPYNTTLSSNSGLVTWIFNMRQPRTDPAGFGSGAYGAAFVLGGTSTSINTTGTGYAIVLGQSGGTDPIRLAKYNNGLQGTLTNIITSNTTGLTDFGTEYLSIKVTYDPTNDQWELFLRSDGASAFSDPATGTLTSQGTATDNTYTGVSLTVLGGYWQGSTSANLAAFFDNVTVSVTASGSPTITTTASLSSFSAVSGTASASQNYTVSGDNLTADVTVTAPAKYEVSTDNTTFTVAVNLAQSGGNLTGEPVTVYVRIAASATAGSANGNIVHSSTDAASNNVAVTGTVIATQPSAHAASFSSSTVSQTQINLTFSAASTITNAAGYIVLQRTGAAPTGAPADGSAYSVGNAIGDGTVAAVITNTASTTTSITGLSAGTQYYFSLFPFNWDGATNTTYNYKTDESVPGTNATTTAPLATTSEVSGPALGSQPNPVTISSLITTDGAAVRVFDMDIFDYGVDTDPTKVTQLTIKAGTNNTANWANSIQGIKLSTDGGATFVTIGSPTIGASSIVIPVASGNLNIPNDDALTVALYIYLKSSGITDNQILEFKVDQTAASHGFVADATGSTFTTTFPTAPVSNQILIDVDATKLAFVQQPTNTLVGGTMTPAVTVEALDANNNRDLDETGLVTITSSGTMTGPVNFSLASGFGTAGNIVHTLAGNALSLTASLVGLSSATSNAFNITPAISAGSILFVGYGMDDPDKFAFITTTFIPEATQIVFTDNAYTGSALATNEGSTTWTSPAGGIPAGSVISIQGTTVTGGGSVGTNTMSLSASGDQILIYQGNSSSPSFIAGLSSTGWISTGSTTSNSSYLPAPLAIYTSAISFSSEEDNGYYSGPTTLANGAAAAFICNSANWTRSGTIQSFPAWSFILGNESITDINATLQDITIALTESLTVNAGNQLTVNGTLTNNAGTSGLVIESDATGTGSLLHNTANVPATIQRYITGNSNLTAYDYHLVSVPLDAAVTSAQFTGSYLYYFDPVSGWQSMGTSTTTPVPVDKGYMIYYPDAATTYNFTGELNNGTFTASTPMTATGQFALVPNPYPSAIDWDAAGGWTRTNLLDAIWIWDPVANQYAAYGAGVGTNGGTQYIPVGQAFFVKSDAAAPVLTMDNNVRVHNTQAFWKADETEKDLIRVKAYANGMSDELVVRFRDYGHSTFDAADVDKLNGSDQAPQLYFLSSDQRALCINTLPYSTETVTVDMGMQLMADGTVTLVFSGFEFFEAGASIFLEDLLTGQMTDLRANPSYAFEHSQGNDPLRFRLHFMGVTATAETAENSLKVWNTTDRIFFSLPQCEAQQALVEQLDLLGRVIHSEQMRLGTVNSITTTANGVVLLRVTDGNKVFTHKLFIR